MNTPPCDAAHGRTRPLSVLRAMIDAVDRDLLQLLGRRYALVAEIADYKREHTVPIRDLQRERELIRDRRDRAVPLGLSPDLTESLFRLILWASRDRQAALKAELPLDVESRTVAVIGGRGAMGRCMAGLFADLGHAVMISDLDTRLTPEEAAADADVVLVSVPIDVTEDVIRRIGPRVRSDALLMDVTSVKDGPVGAMLEASRSGVVGTHPLFAPSVHSLQGQRVVLCRGRGDQGFDWLRRMFHARGLTIVETTPKHHDEMMSVVQVLVHFATEVMGKALVDLGVSIDETLAFTSPIYLMELWMTARHFAQSPELYASIQMSNPASRGVIDAFVRVTTELQSHAAGRDRDAFVSMFNEVKTFFGPFTEQALEQSSFLIDRLVERA
ncbi:MAG: bifunctional chorismate mutase/prephenate dehydrogenase [Phycisphaerae bacterium]